MRAIIQSVIIRSLALLLSVSIAFAQDRPAFKQEELDQMLAPVALYPDSLLSQILMASTYPLEVVQAARWSRSHPNLRGQDAVKAVEQMDWDPSVKSLVAFPQVLYMMDEKIDWTQRLGEVFLAYEPQVMDTVQGLRHRAAAAGNLGSGDQVRVMQQGQTIIIEPANPQLVYVPYYNPTVIYGPWWWPAYPPVNWGPPPGYYFAPAFGPGFIWGSGIVISAGFFFGHFNWHHRHVTVVHQHVLVTRQATAHDHHTNITSKFSRVAWRHDPGHRKGVPYRHAALREQFGGPRTPVAGARQDFHRQESAPAVHQSERERSADFRGGSADGRRAAVATQDGRETVPNRAATQDNDRRAGPRAGRPDERRGAIANPEARGSQLERPVAQGNDARSDPRRDARLNARSVPPQPAVITPARPQARSVDPQPAVVAPDARPQARSVDPQPAVTAPAVRPAVRPDGAAANGNGNARQPAVSESSRRAERGGFSDRGHASHPVTTIRDSVPAPRPSASSGNPAPHMGGGNHRGDSGARAHGGGTHRPQSTGTAGRQS